MRAQFKKILGKCVGFFPTSLPRSVPEFEKFSSQVFSTYDLPELPSYKQALATMIMHLKPTKTMKSKRFFANGIKKAQANQVAYDVIDQIRKAEKEAQTKEVTSNEQPIQN